MPVDPSVVVQLLKQRGPREPAAIASKLGEQVSYVEVTKALAEASKLGRAQPDRGNRWKAT